MQNDASYKRLYAHAELVADVLRSCVREAWIHALDFSTLERVNWRARCLGNAAPDAEAVPRTQSQHSQRRFWCTTVALALPPVNAYP